MEHDPTYTAYLGDTTEPVADDNGGTCGSGALILIGVVGAPTATVLSKKKKRISRDQ